MVNINLNNDHQRLKYQLQKPLSYDFMLSFSKKVRLLMIHSIKVTLSQTDLGLKSHFPFCFYLSQQHMAQGIKLDVISQEKVG